MVFLAFTMSKFNLHIVIYFSLIVIAVAPPANRPIRFCDILSMYESESKLEQLYDETHPKQSANVVMDAFKQCADLNRLSPNADKIVYVLMCQEIEILGREKCKRNPKFDITYWAQTNDEPCSIYHQALQSIPDENFIHLKELPDEKPVPSVVLHYLKNPSINPYTDKTECSSLCGQSAVDPVCDLAALLYITPVQEPIPGEPNGAVPVKDTQQVDANVAGSAPAGQEDPRKDAQTMARDDRNLEDKSSDPVFQETTKKEVSNNNKSNSSVPSKQSQSVPEPDISKPISDKSHLIPEPESPKPPSDKPQLLNTTESLLNVTNKTVDPSLKSDGSANGAVSQINPAAPAQNKAQETVTNTTTKTTANSTKNTTDNSTTKLKVENKTEPSKSEPTNPKGKDPPGDLTQDVKASPDVENKADAALPGNDEKADETELKKSEPKPQPNEDNSKPGDDGSKAAGNAPATAAKEQKITEKTEGPLETNKNSDNEGNAMPKADPEQADETEPPKDTKPKPDESENAILKPDINNDPILTGEEGEEGGNFPDDDGAGQDMEKSVGNEDRLPPIDGDKESIQNSDREPQPEDVPDRKSPPNSVFPEQEDSHFFAYFLTVIIIIILAYLVVHNKQKILGLIVEGRGTQRRRSHSYRKLDSDGSKGSQMIF